MKTIEQFLTEIENDSNIELDLSYAYSDGMTFDEYQEAIDQQINEIEIIYYSKAMQYLLDNDPSLQESLSIASEYGYETSSLNSELLAALLYQQELRQEFYQIADEIEEYFEQYEEYLNKQ